MIQYAKYLLVLIIVKQFSIERDFAILILTLQFFELYLYTVNKLNFPAKHRVYFSGIPIMYFITIDSISIISKRNMVLESAYNTFLCVRMNMRKIRYCTSKL